MNKKNTNAQNTNKHTFSVKGIAADIRRAGSAYMTAAGKVAALVDKGHTIEDIRKALNAEPDLDYSAVSYVCGIAAQWDKVSGMSFKVAKAYVAAARRDQDAADKLIESADYAALTTDNAKAKALQKVGKDDDSGKGKGKGDAGKDKTVDAAATRDALRAILESVRTKKNNADIDAALKLVSNLATLAGALDNVGADEK